MVGEAIRISLTVERSFLRGWQADRNVRPTRARAAGEFARATYSCGFSALLDYPCP